MRVLEHFSTHLTDQWLKAPTHKFLRGNFSAVGTGSKYLIATSAAASMSSRESLGKRFGIEWKIVVVVGFSILGCCLFLALSALLMLALGYIKNFLFGDSRPGTSFYGYCVCCYRNNHKSQEKKLTIVPPPKKAYTPKKYKRQNETYTKSTTLKTNSHSEDVKEMEFTSLYTSASMDDIPSSERLETFSRAQSFAESSPSEIPRALLMTSSPTSV